MKNGLEVFDFKEEDEMAEFSAGKALGKFRNPSFDCSALPKYQFLECVAQDSDVPKKEIGNISCVEADAVDRDCKCDSPVASAPLAVVREDLTTGEIPAVDAAPETDPPSHLQDPFSKIDNHESERLFTELEARVPCDNAPSPAKIHINCSLSDFPSTSEIGDVKSDACEHMSGSSPSSIPPDIAQDYVIQSSHASTNCLRDMETNSVNIAVDYVVYRNNYCTGGLITFSCGGIKINGSTVHGDCGIFLIEREIDDIVCIESHHLRRFETVKVKLQIVSKDAAVQADNKCSPSGVEELELLVVEPNWSGKWEEITSLNVKYLAVGGIVHDAGAVMNGADLPQHRPYFPDFSEAFEDVVYPKGDSDAVSICKRDVDLLEPETFVNDTIIDFYIQYLKNQIPAEEKHRFHFFNSFFFRKLADMDKDPSSASDGRAAFLRVHKWTRKVDIFGKDYIFIPVNFNLHWSLLVICHPGDVASSKDKCSGKSLRVPCILHMDSIRGTHSGLKDLVQRYLWEEWKERHKETLEDLSSKFLNLRFVPLELPQQENSFDCGLFLLHYLELFLVDAPENFSPFRISKFSKFLNLDWFPSSEASLKRTLIQRLISELLENRSQEVSSDDCSDEPESNFGEHNEKGTGTELIPQTCTSPVPCYQNISGAEVGKGIEITLLEASSMRNSECVNDSGLVLRKFIEQGVAARSLLPQCSPFDQSSFYRLNGAMSQIEDAAEAGEQFVYFPHGENTFQQMAGITPQGGSIPYSFRGFGGDSLFYPEIPVEGEDESSSSETSICASDDSDIGIIENHPVENDVSLCEEEELDHQRCSMVENAGCLTECLPSASGEIIETSTGEGGKDPDEIKHNGIEASDLTACQEIPTASPEGPNVIENGFNQDSEGVEGTGDDAETIDDNAATETGELHASKRLRLTPPLEAESLPKSLSKDLHL